MLVCHKGPLCSAPGASRQSGTSLARSSSGVARGGLPTLLSNRTDCCRTLRSTGPRLTVSGQLYHPDCFVCKACHKPFPTHQFMIKDGDAYHSACLPQEPVVICAKCRQTIGCVDAQQLTESR